MSDTETVTMLEMALSMDLDPENGGPLSEARRAEVEAALSTLRGPSTGPDDVQQAAAGPNDMGVDAQLAQIQQQLAALTGGVQQAVQPQQTITLEDVLKTLDPRDSDAALALFGWLWDNGRFGVIGQLNGGGYMLHYQEPKGSSQAGYIAGGTQGGRMVDAAVEKAKAAGAVAVKRGICEKCFSGVREQEDGSVVLDDDDDLNPVCSGGGGHILHA